MSADRTTRGLDLRVLMVAVIAANVAFSVWALVVEGPVPSNIAWPVVLMAIGLIRVRAGYGKGGLGISIASLVFLLIHIPFYAALFGPNCKNPFDDSPCESLLWAFWLLAGPLAALVAGAWTWRQSRRGRNE